MKDLQIISDQSGTVNFEILGSQDDTGLMLLQRLYILLLTDGTGSYHENEIGSVLFSLMEGGNLPPAGVLNSRLGMACASAVAQLDDEDAALIDSFSGTADDNGNIDVTLTLTTGTTIKGVIVNG